MAKWASQQFLDGGFTAFKANVNKQILLKAYTAGDTFATVNTTNNIAEVAVDTNDFVLSNGASSSRVMTAAAQNGVTATADSGASPDLHIAFVDTVNSVVYWVTDETSNQVVTNGNTVNLPSVTYTKNQPV